MPLGADSFSDTQLSCSPALLSSNVLLTNRAAIARSYNPGCAATPPVWAPPRSLAATCGITVVFSSSGYLDVSVPRVGPCFRWYLFKVPGSPIRTSADQRIFAPPRGFSQLVTSFFASESLGIPRTLLLNFLVSSSVLPYSILNCKRFTFDSSKQTFSRLGIQANLSALGLSKTLV